MEILEQMVIPEMDPREYFKDQKICFLDIETTGLSRQYNNIYLIGLLYFDEFRNNWYLKQYFATSPEQESIILDKLNSFITNFDSIITYNGDRFDIPFIRYRSNRYDIDHNIKDIESFDVYREISSNRSYLNLKNFKLKTIEESLGICRDDKFTGKECINFYYNYVNNKDKISKDIILKHNFDDLFHMIDVLRIFDVVEYIKTLEIEFKGIICNIKIKDIIIIEDTFRILCDAELPKDSIRIMYYDTHFNVIWESDSIVIELEAKEGLITPTKKALFLNKDKLPKEIKIKDSSEYIVPSNILLLKVENRYMVNNLKALMKNLIEYIDINS